MEKIKKIRKPEIRKKNKEIRIRISDELHGRLVKLAYENNLMIGAQAGLYIAQGIQQDEYRLKKMDTDLVRGGAEIDSGEQISCLESSEQDNRLRRGKT